MIVSHPVLTSAVLALLFCPACKREDRAKQDQDSSAAAAASEPEPEPLPEPKMIPDREDRLAPSKIEVVLPASPANEIFAAPDVPLVYEDGAYSIRGLREDFDAQIKAGEEGKEVIVRAWVQSIYVPPTDCSDAPCRQHHLWVTDGPALRGRRLAMLVGPFAFAIPEQEAKLWAKEPTVVLEVGKQYSFKGSFKRVSETGFSDPRGVLQFIGVRDPAGEWILPPGAPWHPKTIARYEAEDAAMFEQMRKAAARSSPD